MKAVSDFAFVSCGCAPPSVRMYFPASTERLPRSSTLESDLGSILMLTLLLLPGASVTRSNPTSDRIGPPACGVVKYASTTSSPPTAPMLVTVTVATTGSPAFSFVADSLTGPYMKVV